MFFCWVFFFFLVDLFLALWVSFFKFIITHAWNNFGFLWDSVENSSFLALVGYSRRTHLDKLIRETPRGKREYVACLLRKTWIGEKFGIPTFSVKSVQGPQWRCDEQLAPCPQVWLPCNSVLPMPWCILFFLCNVSFCFWIDSDLKEKKKYLDLV